MCDTENIRGAIAIELEEDNGEADAFDLRNGLTREQAVVLVRRLVSRVRFRLFFKTEANLYK